MLTAKPPKVEKERVDKVVLYILWGFPLGIVSGIVGIGGGVLMVPVTVMALGFKMHQAVGTSTALMILTSVGGIMSYIINGFSISGLPSFCVGYVNLLQWILLAGTSVPMAQVGVRVAHKLPAKTIKVCLRRRNDLHEFQNVRGIQLAKFTDVSRLEHC